MSVASLKVGKRLDAVPSGCPGSTPPIESVGGDRSSPDRPAASHGVPTGRAGEATGPGGGGRVGEEVSRPSPTGRGPGIVMIRLAPPESRTEGITVVGPDSHSSPASSCVNQRSPRYGRCADDLQNGPLIVFSLKTILLLLSMTGQEPPVHVISKRRLVEGGSRHPDAVPSLMRWHRAARAARCNDIHEVRAEFPHADPVGNFTAFNIKKNDYRLITVIHYNRFKVYVRAVLTHAEYDKGDWKGA
jgi:mRNA interferase HigB